MALLEVAVEDFELLALFKSRETDAAAEVLVLDGREIALLEVFFYLFVKDNCF